MTYTSLASCPAISGRWARITLSPLANWHLVPRSQRHRLRRPWRYRSPRSQHDMLRCERSSSVTAGLRTCVAGGRTGARTGSAGGARARLRPLSHPLSYQPNKRLVRRSLCITKVSMFTDILEKMKRQTCCLKLVVKTQSRKFGKPQNASRGTGEGSRGGGACTGAVVGGTWGGRWTRRGGLRLGLSARGPSQVSLAPGAAALRLLPPENPRARSCGARVAVSSVTGVLATFSSGPVAGSVAGGSSSGALQQRSGARSILRCLTLLARHSCPQGDGSRRRKGYGGDERRDGR
jgi:hypothetical protein